jgi:hypothetical protein
MFAREQVGVKRRSLIAIVNLKRRIKVFSKIRKPYNASKIYRSFWICFAKNVVMRREIDF